MAKAKKLPNGKIMYKGKEMTPTAYKNELKRERGGGPAVKKISSSPDEAKAKADKRDAKRSAKALKASGVNKTAAQTTRRAEQTRRTRVEETKAAARAEAKKRVERKPPNAKLSAAEKLASRRMPGGGLYAGRGLGGGAMNWLTK